MKDHRNEQRTVTVSTTPFVVRKRKIFTEESIQSFDHRSRIPQSPLVSHSRTWFQKSDLKTETDVEMLINHIDHIEQEYYVYNQQLQKRLAIIKEKLSEFNRQKQICSNCASKNKANDKLLMKILSALHSNTTAIEGIRHQLTKLKLDPSENNRNIFQKEILDVDDFMKSNAHSIQDEDSIELSRFSSDLIGKSPMFDYFRSITSTSSNQTNSLDLFSQLKNIPIKYQMDCLQIAMNTRNPRVKNIILGLPRNKNSKPFDYKQIRRSMKNAGWIL